MSLILSFRVVSLVQALGYNFSRTWKQPSMYRQCFTEIHTAVGHRYSEARAYNVGRTPSYTHPLFFIYAHSEAINAAWLTQRGRYCIRYWLVASFATCCYLSQSRIIVDRTCRNKFDCKKNLHSRKSSKICQWLALGHLASTLMVNTQFGFCTYCYPAPLPLLPGCRCDAN